MVAETPHALTKLRPKIARNYLTISIEDTPKVQWMEEGENNSIIRAAGPIYHSWLRNDEIGVVGLRFSSWMINRGILFKPERDLMKKWSGADSDFEIFFGDITDHNIENSRDEIVQSTSIVKLGRHCHGISFPMFGVSLDKKEMAALEAKVPQWRAAVV